MKNLGRGIGIGACGIGICWTAITLNEPDCLWAFVALFFITCAMGCWD